MNRAGFTTIEVLIASVLIIALVTAGTAGLKQMNMLQQIAATRTAHSEIRARVLAVLNDSGTCAASLGSPIIVDPPGIDRVDTTVIPQILDGGVTPILVDNKILPPPAVGDGLIYHLLLRFPTPDASETLNKGRGRTNIQYRYAARLEIRATRETLRTELNLSNPNAATATIADLYATIPLSIEIDSTNNKLVYCTVHPDDIDERLAAGSTHTVRDCMQADGFPIPTANGLICRIPVPYQAQRVNGYYSSFLPTGIPTCASLTPVGFLSNPWTEAVMGGVVYNSTIPMTYKDLPVCSGGNIIYTGWHSMAPIAVEGVNFDIKKSAANTIQILLGGAALAATIGNLIFPGLGIAIASMLATLAFIFSLFVKCKSKTVTFYAQINAVGCI
jgi:hypothetical protein